MDAQPFAKSSPTGVRFPRPDAPWMRAIVDPPLRLLERVSGLEQVEAMADEVAKGDPSVPWIERVQRATGIRPEVVPEELNRVPREGGVLVCANHPLGGADSTAVLAAFLSRRPDVKFLANSILRRIALLEPYCIFVDPFGSREATIGNAAALRAALAWLEEGHLLAAFPAGEVSASRWGDWTPSDPPWSTIPARLAIRAQARIVPVWCEGTNSGAFHAVGLVHPRLRTALLPSEFVARCGRPLALRIGRPIDTKGSALDAESMTRLVRGRSELMRPAAAVARAAPESAPVAAPASTADELAEEIAALPRERLLLEESGFAVYAVRAAEIPRGMEEIGRLREIAFRAVGEGSGKPSDTDRFDGAYWQIVLWHRASRAIAGGYRMGVVREVTRESGASGLYTSTLFDLSPALVEKLAGGVEAGRSFVRVEFQRQPLPLNLLWKGIGSFMLRNGLTELFGPVSISNDYNSMSKELIMEFLERHRLAAPFTRLVAPRNPPLRRGVSQWTERESKEAIGDLGALERLIEEIERGRRAVPVLLRHYLRLNARLLAFNVDRDFGDVVDALMLVDLRQVDPRILRYYLGDAAAAVTGPQA